MRNRNVSIILIFLTLICFLIKLQFDVDSDRQSALYGLDKVSSQVNFLDELEKYCVSEDVSGKEGMSPPDGYTLENAVIVVRHGDRTSMSITDGETKSICDLSTYVKPFLDSYKNCIHPKALELLSEFSESNMSCRNSQLTTLGIRQHLEIGKFLREAYKETSLNINDAHLLSTSYSRTALSLVSLVSSFDPKWCQSQQNPIMMLTPHIYFLQCDKDPISGGCEETDHAFCPALTTFKENSPRISKHDWPKDLIHFKKIFARPNATEDDWIAKKNPDSVGDFILSNFCHDKRLPKLCQSVNMSRGEDECITLSEYDQFFQLLQTLYRRRNDSQDYAKYQLLEIISFLKYKIVMYPTKSISFYAGHDLGIEAILVVLGIKMDHHVPYASRLVFEYWTEIKTETTKLRILLNGEILRIGSSDFLKLVELDRLIDQTFEKLFGVDFSWENFQKICNPISS